MNKDLEKLWQEIETKKISDSRIYQRMVCKDMLFRMYIGLVGIPSQRCVLIEIPEDAAAQFTAFYEAKGFTLVVGEPSVKHRGFVACILQAVSSDQNDVFSVVVADVLQELSKQKDEAEYVRCLKDRLVKWHDFFKNGAKKKLTDETVIGLWGELHVLGELHAAGLTTAIDLWNGPIKSAQDFQGKHVAIEVKTAAEDFFSSVNISSETQLDNTGWQALFLIANRIEHGKEKGVSLPALVDRIAGMLSEQQRDRFSAALLCLGYVPEDAGFYSKKYVLKEQRVYQVKGEFPRLMRDDMPKGVSRIQYNLSLKSCRDFLVEMDCVHAAIKEYEHG